MSLFAEKKKQATAALFLSVILPISCLVVFKLSNTSEPPTVVLNPLQLEFERPSGYRQINQVLNATYVDGGCHILFTVFVGIYQEYASAPASVSILTSAEIYGIGDFVLHDLNVLFKNDPHPSAVWWLDASTLSIHQNLSLVEYEYGELAYIHFTGLDSANSAYFQAPWQWNLFSLKNQTNQREIDFSVTYSDGTIFRRVIQPFNITIQSRGFHYFELRTILPSGIEVNGVKVWLDDVEYQSPVTTVLAEKTHVIRLESPIWNYSHSFDRWSDGKYDNPLAVDLDGDWNMSALYSYAK